MCLHESCMMQKGGRDMKEYPTGACLAPLRGGQGGMTLRVCFTALKPVNFPQFQDS